MHDLFGNDQIATVLIKVDDMFSVDSLTRLEKFHTTIEEKTPFIESVDSIYSSGYTEMRGDELHVGTFSKEWPTTLKQAKEMERLVKREPSLIGNFITKDHGYFVVRAKMLPKVKDEKTGEFRKVTEAENKDFVEGLRSAGKLVEADSFKLNFGSQAVLMAKVFDVTTRDTIVFTGLAFLIIIVVLYWLLRRVSGVILPVTVVGLALIQTVGYMAYFNSPVNATFQLIPTLLLLIGVGYSIHFLTHFYSDFNKTQDKKLAVAHALSATATPMLLTSLTTIGGFLSFGVSDIVAIRELGYESAYGVFAAFSLTVIVIPALLSISPIKSVDAKRASFLEKMLNPFLVGFQMLLPTDQKQLYLYLLFGWCLVVTTRVN